MTAIISIEELRAEGPTVSVERAAAALGISRSTGYQAARRGEFPARVITIGRCYRVVTADLLRILGHAE